MLQVDLDHILPESDAFERIREIIAHVEQEKEVYVLTKDGRPVVAIVNVDLLQTLPDSAPTSQVGALDSLFNLAPAAAVESPMPSFIPAPSVIVPEPISAPAAWPTAAPLSAPVLPPLPPTSALPPLPSPTALPDFPLTTVPSVIPTGSILDEPLPPLSGTEFLQPPVALPSSTPPSQ